MNENEKKNLEVSIDETITEMKSKIDEITKVSEEIETDDLKEKALQIKDKTVTVLSSVADKLSTLIKDTANSEEVSKNLQYVKTKASELSEVTLAKLKELKENDKVKEGVDNVKDGFETASDKTKEFAKQVSDKVNEYRNSPEFKENVAKTKEAIKDASVYVKDTANDVKDKVVEYTKSPEFKEGVEKAQDFLKDASDKIMDVASDVKEKISSNEDAMNLINKTSEKATEVYTNAKESYDEFMSKPEVQEKVEKAKDVTIDIAEKAVEALKQWLRPEDK